MELGQTSVLHEIFTELKVANPNLDDNKIIELIAEQINKEYLLRLQSTPLPRIISRFQIKKWALQRSRTPILGLKKTNKMIEINNRVKVFYYIQNLLKIKKNIDEISSGPIFNVMNSSTNAVNGFYTDKLPDITSLVKIRKDLDELDQMTNLDFKRVSKSESTQRESLLSQNNSSESRNDFESFNSSDKKREDLKVDNMGRCIDIDNLIKPASETEIKFYKKEVGKKSNLLDLIGFID